jgi:dihydrofolate reductase
MVKIRMYNFVTTDGFYAGINDEIDWFEHERIQIDGKVDLDHLSPEGPTWKYVTLLNSIDPEHIRYLKDNTAQDMTILGSGTIVRQFFDAGLLDELELMVVPVNLEKGKPLLSHEELSNLTLSEERKYQHGIVSRTYSINN